MGGVGGTPPFRGHSKKSASLSRTSRSFNIRRVFIVDSFLRRDPIIAAVANNGRLAGAFFQFDPENNIASAVRDGLAAIVSRLGLCVRARAYRP